MYKKYIYIHILCKITSAAITKYSSWTQMFMIYRQIEWNTKNTTLLDQNLKIIETCKIDTLRPVTFLVWYRYFNKTWRVKASFMGKHLLQMYCWRWNPTPTSKSLTNLYQTRFVSSTPHDWKWNIMLRLHILKCNYHKGSSNYILDWLIVFVPSEEYFSSIHVENNFRRKQFL